MMCNDVIQKTISLEPSRYRFNGLDASLYNLRDEYYTFEDDDIAKYVGTKGDDDVYRIGYDDALRIYEELIRLIKSAYFLQMGCQWEPIQYSSDIEKFLYVVDSLAKAEETNDGFNVTDENEGSTLVMGLNGGDYGSFNDIFGNSTDYESLDVAREFYIFSRWWLNERNSTGPYLNDLDVTDKNYGYSFITRSFGDEQIDVIRYRTLVDNYTWLRNTIRGCRVLALMCKDECRDELVIGDYDLSDVSGKPCNDVYTEYDPKILLFLNNKGIRCVASIDDITEKDSGVTFFVSDSAIEIEDRFGSIDAARTFYCIAVNYLYPEGGGDKSMICNGDTVQYIDVPFLLTEECDEMGNYRIDELEYNDQKIYRFGDRAVFNGGLYEVVRGSQLEKNVISQSAYYAIKGSITDNGYFQEYDLNTENGERYVHSYIDNSDGLYYNYIPCVYGIDPSDNRYWSRIDNDVDVDSTTTTGYASASYAKYMLNPYRYGDGAEDYLEMTWHNHFIGSDGNMYADYLEEVNYDVDKGLVMFHYYKGVNMGSLSEIRDIDEVSDNFINTHKDNCVEYVEEYEYTINEDGKKVIDFTHSVLDTGDVLLDSNIIAAFTAHTKYNVSKIPEELKYDVTHTPYFIDPSINGIVDRNESVDGGIERGIGAAFERHLILGEVNTMADLENYRNNYFGV